MIAGSNAARGAAFVTFLAAVLSPTDAFAPLGGLHRLDGRAHHAAMSLRTGRTAKTQLFGKGGAKRSDETHVVEEEKTDALRVEDFVGLPEVPLHPSAGFVFWWGLVC
jgi:hypothetical protein